MTKVCVAYPRLTTVLRQAVILAAWSVGGYPPVCCCCAHGGSVVDIKVNACGAVEVPKEGNPMSIFC
jgi:hypothetical protein